MTQGKRLPDLGSVKPLGFPKLDLFQMRGSVKPYEPVKKALLCSRVKLISAKFVSAKETNTKEKFNRTERQKC